MGKPLKLYAHNQKAYNEAVIRLETSNRTCIIHPTGTGKSLIIAKFIEDNPDKKHLVLAPSMHIYGEMKKHTSTDFSFYTYSYLINNVTELTDFDYIYADEFHRIGSEVWGGSFKELIYNNPKAKVIGTSATNIRFLDDNRDMATEIFNDNIASSLSIAEAIRKNILKPPDYVLGVYDSIPDFRKLKDSIEASPAISKKELLKKLKTYQVDWEHAKGLKQILKKYITPDRKKIIVFCKSIRHIEHVKKAMQPALTQIFGNIKLLTVHSSDAKYHNEARIDEFNKTEDATVMFAIDMINEGLHVKGCNTVVLVRDTISPILYYQQIGRAFSIGQEDNALILDFARNLTKIKNRERILVESSNNSNVLGNSQEPRHHSLLPVKIHDESKELNEIIEHFSNQIEYWEAMYDRAVHFYNEHGSLEKTFRDKKLNTWLIYIRRLRRSNNLSSKKIAALDTIGMVWEVKKKHEQYIDEINEFLNDGGILPQNRSENKRLYDIINRLKKAYREGKLKEDLVYKAKSLFPIDTSIENIWQKNYEKAKKIFEEKSYVMIPRDDKELGTWSTSNRVAYRNNSISPVRLKMLNEINFVFNTQDFSFHSNLEELTKFFKKNKRLPTRSESKKLTSWITYINKKFKEGQLSGENVNLLNRQTPGWSNQEDVKQKALDRHVQNILSHWHAEHSIKRKNGDSLTMSINYIRNIYNKGDLPIDIQRKLTSIPGLFKYKIKK